MVGAEEEIQEDCNKKCTKETLPKMQVEVSVCKCDCLDGASKETSMS